MASLVRIVLIDPSHPGNVGSVARAMKNMALDDLTLVRPRSFPHPESNALAAGADDILAKARVVDSVVEAIGDCAFIAGTTSRPRSYYWEFTTPARGRRAHRRARRGESRGAAVRLGALRPRHRGSQPLQRAGAHPGESRVLLAQSRHVGAAARLRDCSWRASSRNSHVQLEQPLAPVGRRRAFLLAPAPGARTKSISRTAPGI